MPNAKNIHSKRARSPFSVLAPSWASWLGGLAIFTFALPAAGESASKSIADTAQQDLAANDADLLGVITGAKASYIFGYEEHHSSNLGGFGLFAETVLIEHWIEVEASARLIFGHGTGVPVELLFKKPFHLHSGHVFVGLGPALITVFDHGKRHTEAGGVTSIGILHWWTPKVALVAELNYTLIVDSHLVHEAGVNIGVGYHL